MVKAKKYVSRNQIQHLVYALITVFITVHAFVLYSLYVIEGDGLMQATGTTSVWRALDCQGGVYMFGDYLPVWLMIIIETAFAFVLAVTMGSPLANCQLSLRNFRFLVFKYDGRFRIGHMALVAPSQPRGVVFSVALSKPSTGWFLHLPFAYFSQMFFVQPFVRFVIRRLFAGNIAERNELNSDKTVKPLDESDAIADVIIRENEIAAMDK